MLIAEAKENMGREIVNYSFTIKEKCFDIYVKSLGAERLNGTLESQLVCLLLPCMKAGELDLMADGPVSEKFLRNNKTVQDILCNWDTSMKRVSLVASGSPPLQDQRAGRVGTFFSGGIDSYYTLLKHNDEITDLIFAHGLDIKLNDDLLRRKTSEKIHEIAQSFGKNVVELETNVRTLLNPYVAWGPFGHGPALASIGHMLSASFSRIYIPASHTYTQLFPWGTHPVLDYLWGTETLEFIHDGCGAKRTEKVALVSGCDVALKTLRVCWRNPNSAYNCGRCEKCVRTMISLKAHGVLDKCTVFDEAFNLANLHIIDPGAINVRGFLQENIEALQASGADPELEKLLREILLGPSIKKRIIRRLRRIITG